MLSLFYFLIREQTLRTSFFKITLKSHIGTPNQLPETCPVCHMYSLLSWLQHWEIVSLRPQAGYYGTSVSQTDQLDG